MNEINEINDIVVPEVPKVISNEQIYVYVPLGTDEIAGLIKFNLTYFYRDVDGKLCPKLSSNLNYGVLKGNYTATDIAEHSEDVLIDTVDGKIQNVYLKTETNEYATILSVLDDINGDISGIDERVYNLEDDVSGFDNRITQAENDASDAKITAQSALDAIAGKQDTLVSGINIKTINSISLLGSGNINIESVYLCTYGTTTFAQITQALTDKKPPILIYNNMCYYYVFSSIGDQVASNNKHYFAMQFKEQYNFITVDGANSWVSDNIVFEKISNKVTSISNASTDTQYPSAKLLYDKLQLKQDTLSQTQLDAVNSGINSTLVGKITTNENNISSINLKIPNGASSSNKLTTRDEVVGSVDLSINSSTYVITLQCKDVDGNNLGNAKTIDLPLESVVVNGSYDSTNKKVILTLQNGSTIEFSVADLVSGLQTEITSNNKLDSDLVDDTNQTHKFVSSSEKSTWNGKQDALSQTQLDAVNSGITSSLVTKIGSATLTTTATDLSGAVNELNSGKQNVIDASHKLSADYLQDGSNNKVFSSTEKTKLSGIESGAQVNTVTSVNTKTGAVVLDADDIDDTNTDNKFVSSTDILNWNGKSTVVANPTLVGTEADLTSLEIDGIKYKITSGAGGIANGVAYEIV